MSGEIPPELGSLSNLVTLSLGGNDLLSGEIPAWLGSLSNLTEMGLSRSGLRGCVPRAWKTSWTTLMACPTAEITRPQPGGLRRCRPAEGGIP